MSTHPTEQASREQGFTVSEVLIVVMLVSIVGTILFGFLNSTTAVTKRASDHVQAETDATLALRTITQDVRAANPVLEVYPQAPTSCAAGTYPADHGTCLHLVVSRSETAASICTVPGGGPQVTGPYTRITYALRNGSVLQDLTEYSSSCSVVRSYSGRVIIANVVNSRLFNFYSPTGSEIAVGSAIGNASGIKTTLTIRYLSSAPALTVSSNVALRNQR